MSVLVPTSDVLSRIEHELRDLWIVPTGPNEVPKSRVCTMNLIVVAGSTELAERYTPIVDEVTMSIPARALIVTLDPEAQDSTLSGDVSAVCALGDTGKAMCSERVRLAAAGAVCGRVASAIDALLVPEIPTTLVWLGRVHVDDPVFLGLAKESYRVVLDTEYTSLASLLHLARWARAAPGRPHVADLAWTRLAPWQEMCARFFDEPTLRNHATRISRLTLKQASEPRAPLGSEGSLLLGWFATRLGWKLAHLGGTLLYRRPDGGTVSVDLGAVARPHGVAPAALAGVCIEADVDGIVARGSLERDLASGLDPASVDADVLVWKMQVDLPSATEQRVRLGDNKGAKLLERTLHRPASDPTLEESVAFAEEMFEEGVICG